MASVLIMAGGTGGHIYPGLAVARELQKNGIEVTWMGTRKGLESRVIPQADIEIDFVSISGIKGRGLLPWMLMPFRLTYAFVQSVRILMKRRPSVVLSMGGFVAGPGGVMAWLLRRPLIIHEQNAIPGFTNRMLALFARRILTGFPAVFGRYPKALYTGNPVRDSIRNIPLPEDRPESDQEAFKVLIIGGSRGARRINQVMADVFHFWSDESAPEVWHQCGEQLLQETTARYGRHAEAGSESRLKLVPFIDNMDEAYAWADVVVCRAGAMTIAELACAGLASVLIPFPYAADDHQTANADYLVQRDAAILIPEDQLSAKRLHEVLHELAHNRQVVKRMANQARSCAMPDAAETVAGICRESMYA